MKNSSKHCTSQCKCADETITTLKCTKLLENCNFSVSTWYRIASSTFHRFKHWTVQLSNMEWNLFILLGRVTVTWIPIKLSSNSDLKFCTESNGKPPTHCNGKQGLFCYILSSNRQNLAKCAGLYCASIQGYFQRIKGKYHQSFLAF